MAIQEFATLIDIGRDFARLPFGRVPKDGPNNATKFRDTILIPAIQRSPKVIVVFDNARGLGSSFLEETFGMLVEKLGWTKSEFQNKVQLISSKDPTLIDDALMYVEKHQHGRR